MSAILFLAHRLPYPPDRGDRIRSWHMLRRLARRHAVHVLALIDDEADRAHVDTVADIAASVTVAPRPGRARAIARALRRGTPASVEAFVSPALEGAAARVLDKNDIAGIFAYSGQMAHYVPPGRAFTIDFVDMDSAKFAAGGWASRYEGRRLLDWEIRAAQRADAALFVSEPEAALFRAATGLPAQVVENGIDAARFDPEAVTPIDAPHPLIVFTGQMDYAPNVRAVTDFVRDVLPRIAAHFAIVGRAPTAAVRALAGDQVIVTGEVADTRPWLAAADVVVAPLKLARGVQNKVLEAMAMARPVVLSAAAATGIDARAFVVADDPAEAINALLADPAGARALGAAARARVLARYDWEATLAPLDMLFP